VRSTCFVNHPFHQGVATEPLEGTADTSEFYGADKTPTWVQLLESKTTE